MRIWRAAATVATVLLGMLQRSTAYDLDTSSTDSIRDVAGQMAEDMMSFYKGNLPGQTPGLLPDPYYWWEAGALMGALIDYWYYTGDSRYNDITTDGLLHQVGPDRDYMPPNQTRTEGNDDQGFWGMAVMSAAEYNFPNPPPNEPQWLALAQAVFNTQAWRWDMNHCGGGLRWQVFQFNNGWNYKNSISQACFFNLAARLALYTGNSSYAVWADRTWDWMESVRFIDENYYIYDGAHIEDGCTQIIPWQFSYNSGAFLLGAAAMYNYTSAVGEDNDAVERWRDRIDGLLQGAQEIFFRGPEGDIMAETACEPTGVCNVDQKSFKAYLSRWMAATTKWAPWTYDVVMPLLRASAVAAASVCNGGDNGRMCALEWTHTTAGPPDEEAQSDPGGVPAPALMKRTMQADEDGVYGGKYGVGQQMAAMEVVLAGLIEDMRPPVTTEDGGISEGKPNAGGYYGDPQIFENGNPADAPAAACLRPIVCRKMTKGDTAGGVIVTLFALMWLSGFLALMFSDEHAENPLQRRFWRGLLRVAGFVVCKDFTKYDDFAKYVPPPSEKKGKKGPSSAGPSTSTRNRLQKPQPPPRPPPPEAYDGPRPLTIRSSSHTLASSTGNSHHPPYARDILASPRPGGVKRRGHLDIVRFEDDVTPPVRSPYRSTTMSKPTTTSLPGSSAAESSRMAYVRAMAAEYDGLVPETSGTEIANIASDSCPAGDIPCASQMTISTATDPPTRRPKSNISGSSSPLPASRSSSVVPRTSSSRASVVADLQPPPRAYQRPEIGERSSSLYQQTIELVNMNKALPPVPLRVSSLEVSRSEQDEQDE